MESYLDTLPVETLEDIIDYLSVKDINCLQKAYPIWKNSSFIHLKVLNLTREHGKIKQRRVPYINGCEPGMNYGEYIKYESKFYDACIAKEWKRLMEWEDVIDTVPYRVRQDGIFQKLRSVDHFQERQNLVLLAIEKKWVDPNRRYRRGEGEFGCCFTDKRDLSNMPLDTVAFNMYKQIDL
ncbi:hypothetical protein HDV02_001721 [Globomyces sp. JEL0801]|nr:hypothetical protein HDV02_001721 [Globomyces sp. JEL0801]